MSAERREMLSSVLEEMSSDDDSMAQGATVEHAGAETGGEVAEAAGSPAEQSGDDGGGIDTAARDDAQAARSRDEKGRFAAQAKEKAAAKAAKASAVAPKSAEVAATGPAGGVRQAEQKQSPGVPPSEHPTSTASEFKAPQSWKPSARELLAKAPAEVQQEVIRREREIAAALQEAAPDRKLAQDMRQALAPYEPSLRARGVDPMREVQGLLQTSHALAYAPPQQKAAIVAGIIQSFGVPIEELAAALEGKAPQAQQQQAVDPHQLAQQIEQRVLQNFQAQQQQAAKQRVAQEVTTFGQGKEFYDKVRVRMGAIIQAEAAQGVELSLEDAYNQACWADPEVRKSIQQREADEQAKARKVSTQQARAASSSIKSRPAGPVSPQPQGRREMLSAVMSELNGG